MADNRITSIFGTYAQQLQVFIDLSADKFAPTWFEKYFDWGVPQTNLTFVTAIGRSRIEAAASIVDRDSPAPMRSRLPLEKLAGEVPAIKEKFKMTESDYRNWMTLQNINIADSAKKKALLNLMFEDVKRAGDSTNKRIDYMCLEAISTGQITVTVTNNPDGVVSTTAIDLFMPSANKTTAPILWSTANAATALPFSDILKVVNDAELLGRSFSKILMSRSRFFKMIKTDELRNALAGFFRLGAQNKNQLVNPTIAQINEYLVATMLPEIEIINNVVGIEKDGIITSTRPFNDASVVFIPDGKLGVIHNSVAIEKMRPVEGVAYADYNYSLISKWSENEPFGEWTKAELNAFPGIETINGIFILTTE